MNKRWPIVVGIIGGYYAIKTIVTISAKIGFYAGIIYTGMELDEDYKNRKTNFSSFNNRKRKKPIPIFIFGKQEDAETVLNAMKSALEMYGVVTMANYLDFIGDQVSNFKDTKFGWTNLTDVKVIKEDDGYKINLPKPKKLDDTKGE